MVRHDFDGASGGYGREFYLDGEKIPQEFLDWIEAMLIADAREILPVGTPFEIRRKTPGGYGRPQCMAWYYSPYQALREPGPVEGGNYTLMRQVVA